MLAVTGLGSCINDSSECPQPMPEQQKENMYIRFSIMTKNDLRTRAADINGDQVGTGYENELNINDIKYFLYDNDKRFIQDITAVTQTVAANKEYTVYNVVAKLDNQYFKDNINGFIDFYILVIANYSGWGVTVPTPAVGDNIENFFNNGLEMTKVPDTGVWLDPDSSLYPESTYPNNKFPMAGLQHFSFPGSMLMNSGEQNPYDMSIETGKNVNLLRTLAKIEIIDKINIGEDEVFDEVADVEGETGALRIKQIKLFGYFGSGKLIPSVAQWNRNSVFETQQVIAPSTDGMTYVAPQTPFASLGTDVFAEGANIKFHRDEAATKLRKDKCPVFSCYVFEYSDNSISEAYLPYFIINTHGYTPPPEVGGNVYPSLNYALSFKDLINNSTNPPTAKLGSLLRNHIYRFEISGISQGLQVQWTVCDMDSSGDIDIPPFS